MLNRYRAKRSTMGQNAGSVHRIFPGYHKGDFCHHYLALGCGTLIPVF